jgi:hypothetical protein
MSKNQTITYRPAIANKRVEAAVTREIKASPGNIFPLACPVEELRWIPEWDYQLIYSKSGVNETNCIFNEDKSGAHIFEKPLTTTWVTTIHDPENYRILFQLNLAGKAVRCQVAPGIWCSLLWMKRPMQWRMIQSVVSWNW